MHRPVAPHLVPVERLREAPARVYPRQRKLLAALVGAARSTSVPDVCAVADTVSYEGARGFLHLNDHHLDQPVYLSVADGLEFNVLAQMAPP